MAVKTYAEQLDEAKEALQLLIAGQLQSHSTLSGSYQHFTPHELRAHIDWLEDKATREQNASVGSGRKYCAIASQGNLGRSY